jgi:hypothetical protein
MTETNRVYKDGAGTDRALLVDEVAGVDKFGYYDPITHAKLDEVVTAVEGISGGSSANSAESAASAVSVTTSDTTLLDVDVSGYSRLGVYVSNAGSQAFSNFSVQTRWHSTGAFVTRLDDASSFTSLGGMLLDASGDLTVLANGANGWLELDVSCVQTVRLRARVASSTTSVNVLAIAKR